MRLGIHLAISSRYRHEQMVRWSGTALDTLTVLDIAMVMREGWAKSATFSHDGPKIVRGNNAYANDLACGRVSLVSKWEILSFFSWVANRCLQYRLSPSHCTVSAVFGKMATADLGRYKNTDQITSLAFSPTSNLLAFTSIDGSFHRWRDPISKDLPSPTATEAQQAKKLDRILDDLSDGGDIEEKGENLDDEFGDDWIVDDDNGVYGAAAETEEKWGAGRTEVGEWLIGS
jgi:chromosome transmission fidelity protein 4